MYFPVSYGVNSPDARHLFPHSVTLKNGSSGLPAPLPIPVPGTTMPWMISSQMTPRSASEM